MRPVVLSLLLAAPASAGLFPPNPFTDSARGTTTAPFLKLQPGARAQALGGSFSAVLGDPDQLFWNPAGLATVGASTLGLGYNSLLEGANLGSFGYIVRREDRVFGFGFIYAGQEALEGYTAVGDPTGNFEAFDFSPSVAVGKEFYGAYIGAGFKLVSSSLAGEKGSTIAADIGVIGKDVTVIADGTVDAGACLTNLGPGLKRGSQTDPLPFQVAGGMLWRAYPNFRILADAHMAVDQSPYATLGAEYGHGWAGGAAALRAGYSMRNRKGLAGSAGLTAGFGLDFQKFKVDYAWVPLGELGDTHRFTLAMRF